MVSEKLIFDRMRHLVYLLGGTIFFRVLDKAFFPEQLGIFLIDTFCIVLEEHTWLCYTRTAHNLTFVSHGQSPAVARSRHKLYPHIHPTEQHTHSPPPPSPPPHK